MPSKSHTSGLATVAIQPHRRTSSTGISTSACAARLQHRSGDGVSLGGQQREAVEQEVEGTRTTPRRREGLDGAADLQQDAAFGEMPRHTGCTPSGQVSLAREIRVEWLETSRGLEQQPRSILPETRSESDVAAQHRNASALELVERPGLRRGHQPERRVERAALEARLRRG